MFIILFTLLQTFSYFNNWFSFSSVPLTVTKKKHYDTKKDLVSEIQDCCDKYAHIFVLQVHNDRNNLLKEVRESWKHSRLVAF